MAIFLSTHKPRLIGLLFKILLLCISVGAAVFFSWKKIETDYFDKVIYQKWSLYGYVSADKTYNMIGSGKLPFLVDHRLKDLRTLWQHVADDTDYPERNSTKVFKVAYIGDSYAYGLGVLESERITNLLEKKLNMVRPTKVYNFSQMADDVLEYYSNYRAAEKYLQPDLYIVGMVWNDFETPMNKYPGQDKLRQRLKAVCPEPDFWEQFSPESNSWEDIIGRHTLLTLSPKNPNYCYMREFVRDIHAGKRVMFFNFNHFSGYDWCAKYDYIDHINQSFVIKEYENLVYQADGVVFGIDVEDWKHWKPVSPIEAHPGKSMHAQGAQILFNELLREPLWGFVKKPVNLYEWQTIWSQVDENQPTPNW